MDQIPALIARAASEGDIVAAYDQILCVFLWRHLCFPASLAIQLGDTLGSFPLTISKCLAP